MRFNSAAACALAALLLASSFALVLLQKRGWDASALVVAGDQFASPAEVPAGLRVERSSAGYDGQFYYRLALDPFTTRWIDYGIRFDYPTYRQQRILMPLLIWILSVGTPAAVPVLFIIVNVLAVVMLAWSSALLVRDIGVNVWWSAAVWLYPGWVLTMARDCVEIMEVALLISMALALRRKRVVVATLLGICAVLTKETALLGVAALAAAHLAPLPFVAPAAAHFGLKMVLFRVWDAKPSLGLGHFSVPFAGLVAVAASPTSLLWKIEVLAIVVMAVLALLSIRRAPLPLVIAFAAYVPLVAILDQSFWIEDWSFLRATSEYWVLAGAVAAVSHRWIRVVAITIGGVLWIAVAGAQI